MRQELRIHNVILYKYISLLVDEEDSVLIIVTEPMYRNECLSIFPPISTYIG